MDHHPARPPSSLRIAATTTLTTVLAAVTLAIPADAVAFVGVSSVRAQWFENTTIPFYPVDAGELFGAALAAGDFNGDGAMDLAIGVPQDSGSTIEPEFETGAVYIRWGVPGGGLAAGPATTILNAYAEGSRSPRRTHGSTAARSPSATSTATVLTISPLVLLVPGRRKPVTTAWVWC